MSPGFRSLMWYLLFGTRGGPNRRRLLEALDHSPANAHQLAAGLHLDYRTVRHHLRLLERHGAVTRPVGDAYATPYEISGAASVYLATAEPVKGPTRRSANRAGRSTSPPVGSGR